MIKGLLNGILKALSTVVGFILTPLNSLVANLFPNMASTIATFNNFVNTYFGSNLTYFFSMFPPIFKGLLSLFLTFCVTYYTVHYTYIAIVKVFAVIQKIKFW